MDPLQSGDPTQAGRYRLIGRLGEGGMAQVFLGSAPDGRKVAVKLILPELAGRPKFRERFAREVEAARKVTGPYTAQVIDADPHAQVPWLVTAYVAGPSLRDVVSEDGPRSTRPRFVRWASGWPKGWPRSTAAAWSIAT